MIKIDRSKCIKDYICIDECAYGFMYEKDDEGYLLGFVPQPNATIPVQSEQSAFHLLMFQALCLAH